jgi:hypothetical protein
MVGMPSHDLVIAALVSVAVSFTAAIGAVYLTRGKTTDHIAR